MKKTIFFTEYFKKPKTVGAVARSSRFLIKGILEEIDFGKSEIVVEFGAGDGNITKEVLKKLSPKGSLIVFEIHRIFLSDLKKIKDKRLIIVPRDAASAKEELEKIGISKINIIISSIPIAPMSGSELTTFFENIKGLIGDEGAYIQYTYTPNHHGLFLENFGKVKLKFTLLNIPPAFIYVCRK